MSPPRYTPRNPPVSLGSPCSLFCVHGRPLPFKFIAPLLFFFRTFEVWFGGRPAKIVFYLPEILLPRQLHLMARAPLLPFSLLHSFLSLCLARSTSLFPLSWKTHFPTVLCTLCVLARGASNGIQFPLLSFPFVRFDRGILPSTARCCFSCLFHEAVVSLSLMHDMARHVPASIYYV